MEKYIYVFSQSDRDYLISRGFISVYSDDKAGCFGFLLDQQLMDQDTLCYLSGTTFVKTNTAYF